VFGPHCSLGLAAQWLDVDSPHPLDSWDSPGMPRGDSGDRVSFEGWSLDPAIPQESLGLQLFVPRAVGLREKVHAPCGCRGSRDLACGRLERPSSGS
jgi:hypothetical protein